MKAQGNILRYSFLKHTLYSRAHLIFYFQLLKNAIIFRAQGKKNTVCTQREIGLILLGNWRPGLGSL